MTRPTSSSSVHGTTEGPRQDQTGRQPIDSNSETIWKNAEAIDRFLRAYGAVGKGRERMTDWDYNWFNFKAIVRHLFGIHTLILSEEWKKTPEGVRIQKRGMRCWRCEYREA
jgi:hypothetical protein